MKKITLLLVGMMASGMASAVQLEASGPVTVLNCTLLNEDVAINLTTGVNAGVSCSTQTIAMAACHTAGRVTSRSAMIDSAGADCGPAPATACTGTLVSTPVEGAAMPTATTAAGTVISQYPGTGVCDAVKAETNATAAVTAADA